MTTLDEIISKLDSANYERFNERKKELMPVKCFKYNGVIFKGNYEMAAALFVYENPQPADFYVWLQNNYKQL